MGFRNLLTTSIGVPADTKLPTRNTKDNASNTMDPAEASWHSSESPGLTQGLQSQANPSPAPHCLSSSKLLNLTMPQSPAFVKWEHYSFISFFCSFYGRICSTWNFLSQGPIQSCHYRLTPQPEQHQIQAYLWLMLPLVATPDPLTHWARPGIQPTSSWILVGFLTHWATIGAPPSVF